MNSPLLRLFVYGSLKRGFDNHNRYCRGVRSIESAQTEGRLFRQPTGYPVLRLPERLVLAGGSANLRADLETVQRAWKGIVPTRINCWPKGFLGRNRVHGVLLTFDDSISRLRSIDRLEEFRPGRKSRYERVLVSVYSRIRQAQVPVWTYVAGELSAPGRLIPSGEWNG